MEVKSRLGFVCVEVGWSQLFWLLGRVVEVIG